MLQFRKEASQGSDVVLMTMQMSMVCSSGFLNQESLCNKISLQLGEVCEAEFLFTLSVRQTWDSLYASDPIHLLTYLRLRIILGTKCLHVFPCFRDVLLCGLVYLNIAVIWVESIHNTFLLLLLLFFVLFCFQQLSLCQLMQQMKLHYLLLLMCSDSMLPILSMLLSTILLHSC